MVRVTGAKYPAWEDAFEVDFEDGLTFLEPHATIREANKISAEAKPVRVDLDEEPCIGFLSTTTTARPPKFDGHLCGSCHQKFKEISSPISAQKRSQRCDGVPIPRHRSHRSGLASVASALSKQCSRSMSPYP